MFKFASNIVQLALGLLMLPTYAVAGSCICLACIFDVNLENFRAQGESMSPTLNSAECSLMRHIDPLKETIQLGDVIGFRPQPSRPVFVFRVVATAGDTIGVRRGQIILNGEPIPQVFLGRAEIIIPENPPLLKCETTVQSGEVCTRSRYREILSADSSYEIYDAGITRGDEMAEITVPAMHVFVMGDHRDNALDSRFSPAIGGPGVIALHRVVGIFDEL